MNKTIFLISLIILSSGVSANQLTCEQLAEIINNPASAAGDTRINADATVRQTMISNAPAEYNSPRCREHREAAARAQRDQQLQGMNTSQIVQSGMQGNTQVQKCQNLFNMVAEPAPNGQQNAQNWISNENTRRSVQNSNEYKTCVALKALAEKVNPEEGFSDVDSRSTVKKSADQSITCSQAASYTVDYRACLNAIKAYDAIANIEMAMQLQQKVRTDLATANMQKDVQRQAAEGDAQSAAIEAEKRRNNFAKGLNQEKIALYTMAFGTMTAVYAGYPGKGKAKKECQSAAPNKDKCEAVSNRNDVLSNQGAKAALAQAIGKYAALGLAAGMAKFNNQTAENALNQVQQNTSDDSGDGGFDLCAADPMAPGCAGPGNRVRQNPFGAGGTFSAGSDDTNSFNLDPLGVDGTEIGAAPDVKTDDANEVASINNPFVDDAKEASKILNPAGAAQIQATGGAGGGGSGGGGGGGGGGASLGSDLNGANKDGDKEAQIKTNKVAGNYQFGGGGFKAVGKGKDDSNPFANLFDQKGSGGGVEEDRSIASGDIDGAASGLFQKISKRYGQVQADKRIEAKNLE